jgi:hypothetical protein
MSTEQQSKPELSWDEAMRLAKTDASALAARLRGDKVLVPLAPSLWPTKRVRRVSALRWAWVVTDHGSGEVLESGRAPTERWAWTRTDRAAKRIYRERAEAARRAES